MDSGSTALKADGRGLADPGGPLRLMAQTVVAVAQACGCGDEEDDRELDAAERMLWIELRLACPDRQEREQLIADGHAVIAPPGPPACRHAAALLLRAGGWLLHAAASAEDEERHRMEACSDRCARTAARLERIALEASGS